MSAPTPSDHSPMTDDHNRAAAQLPACAQCGHKAWAHGDLHEPRGLGDACHASVDFAACRCPGYTPLVPDELVIDDDGPRAGELRPATPADYAPETFGWFG